ncbi:MAG: ATP-dependent 6-phosphofructokinase [Candidatus Dormiibacterota bacterium]|jgi:6-phosphofructokinase 1|nr:ATP-dependent 6-phosphofructokinase [Candidatus Dormibacteraeota bacterium]
MRIGVMTSGGDAPGMNAAIRAVVRRAFTMNCETVGFLHGFNGLVKGEWRKMTQASVAGIIQRGGTILRTARSRDFEEEEGRAAALRTVEKTGVEGLVVIGGGGSAVGGAALDAMGLPVVTVPSTIDNDLLGTDVTIGHMSAVDTVVQNVNRIRDTATSHERIFVIETMGRDTGHIALDAGLASGAESILIPEIETPLEDVSRRILNAHARGKSHSIIMLAEGYGHGFDVARTIQEESGLETRVIVLGHLQRGGSPLASDRIIASRLGAHATDMLVAGRHGIQVGLISGDYVETPLDVVTSKRREIDLHIYDLARSLSG